MKRLAFVVLLLPVLAAAQQTAAPELTIEAISAGGGITGRAPDTIKWSPDGTKVSFIQRDDSGEQGELWYVDVASGKRAVLVAQQKLETLAPPLSQIKSEQQKEAIERYSIASYHWAPDSQHLLFDAQGQLWLYSLASGTATQVTSGEPANDPKFSPDGSRIAFIRDHDLWVQPLKDGNPRRLTTGNKEGKDDILDGEVDWVYEEELDVRSNYFWSSDGSRLLFLQMDETRVPTYPIENFLATHPSIYRYRYPKAGDPNPTVRVGVIGASGGKVRWLNIPPAPKPADGVTPEPADIYIPRFGWVRDGLAWVEVLNRAQNQLDLYFVDVASGHSKLMVTEKSDTWVEVNDDFQVLSSGDQFLWGSWRDGHTHLYLYSFNKQDPLAAPATLVRQLTHGDFETFGVPAVDESTGTVYIITNDGDSRQRQLYAVKLDGSGYHRISREEGTHDADFSDDAHGYVDDFSALMTPPRMQVCRTDGTCKVFWQSRSIEPYKLIPPQFVDFTADDGTVLHGQLLLPPNPTGKVPLIIYAYGGQQVQSVRDEWGGQRFLFHEIMARDGFAILTVDNRGMGARGKKFAAANWRRFGPVELKDQFAALDQALARFSVLDGTRIGWWGWSYGGYFTLYAMTHSDRIKAGVAGAPVTNWLDYDTIYTERYMGLPKDNQEGYRQSSPVNTADSLHGDLLIEHGTGDDNVHFQNTVQMAQSLIEAGKQAHLMIYPGKTHGISGAADLSYLYHQIEDHFHRVLMGR